MSYRKLVKTKKEQLECKKIPYFCGAVVECFKFLIEENGFDKAMIKHSGKEYRIEFRKEKLIIGLSYEMGSLPTIFLFINSKEINLSEIDSSFSEDHFLNNYKLHKKIRFMVNTNYSCVDEYIEALGNFWNENKQNIMDEIQDHVRYLSGIVKDDLTKILSYNNSQISLPKKAD